MSSRNIHKSGFTLLEILLVVGIIAVLAGIVILAINPNKMLANTRNTQRKANLSEINKALYQYYIDHSHYPTSVTSSPTEICNTGASSTPTGINCVGLADLSALVPIYLTAIPTDPQSTASSTKYKVMKTSANKVVLEAPQAELDTTVVVGSVDCGLSFVDSRDGKRYATVLIGSQCWMQQNLNVGTRIASTVNQGGSTTSIQKYCYSNLDSNCDIHGGLYQWNQAMGSSTTAGAQGICPSGWHIPTDAEYKTLIEGQATLGCESTGWQCSPAGSHLSNLTLGHDNTSGFTALLSGYSGAGSFDGLGSYMFLWSSLQGGTSALAWSRSLSSGFTMVYRNAEGVTNGVSLRCVRN